MIRLLARLIKTDGLVSWELTATATAKKKKRFSFIHYIDVIMFYIYFESFVCVSAVSRAFSCVGGLESGEKAEQTGWYRPRLAAALQRERGGGATASGWKVPPPWVEAKSRPFPAESSGNALSSALISDARLSGDTPPPEEM